MAEAGVAAGPRLTGPSRDRARPRPEGGGLAPGPIKMISTPWKLKNWKTIFTFKFAFNPPTISQLLKFDSFQAKNENENIFFLPTGVFLLRVLFYLRSWVLGINIGEWVGT